jgi:hypothetical protein
MDLVLADVATMVPFGLVPDFLDLVQRGEECVDRVRELYSDDIPIVTPT